MRKSTGKVKLREANGVLMFTIPKSVASRMGVHVGDTFKCESYYGKDESEWAIFDEYTVAFHRVEKFKVKIG